MAAWAYYTMEVMETAESTSRRMAAVRHEATSVEMALRRAVRKAGLVGYRVNLRTLPGAPDMAFTRWRVAVFVDGAFWHGHPRKFPEQKMSEYWLRKIERNRRRDRRVSRELRRMGWRVLRFWDFEVEADPRRAVRKIRGALGRAQSA
ncbi:MAG: DNA mismatch endonuclease Vsr [Dehalococcoidia bacterium]|nr:MAG: DNA mismatch endonuclease Vsr [Dehalococcoidia bacterium]